MRQDISVDAINGDLNTADNLTNKVIYKFEMLSGTEYEADRYCYAEITVPANFESYYTENGGIHTYIPYFAMYSEFYVRFKIVHNNGSIEYITNKTNNSVFFPVYTENDSKGTDIIRLSELCQINANGNFNLLIREGYLALYSGDETDFQIKAAKSQNEIFLLKAFAGNLYQHPTTGVGLVHFLNGNFENSGLASKLQQEFENDKMIIDNAYMDSLTGELYLEVREKNG